MAGLRRTGQALESQVQNAATHSNTAGLCRAGQPMKSQTCEEELSPPWVASPGTDRPWGARSGMLFLPFPHLAPIVLQSSCGASQAWGIEVPYFTAGHYRPGESLGILFHGAASSSGEDRPLGSSPAVFPLPCLTSSYSSTSSLPKALQGREVTRSSVA